MSNTLHFKNDDLAKKFFADLEKGAIEAAEPFVKQAVDRFEQEFRRSLATRVVALIRSDFAVESYGQELKILVKNPQDERQTKE